MAQNYPNIIGYCPILPDIVRYRLISAEILAPLTARLISHLARHNNEPAQSEILMPDPVTTLSWMVKIYIAQPWSLAVRVTLSIFVYPSL